MHDEIRKSLAEAERSQKRESHKANEMLAANGRAPAQAVVDSTARREWEPLPGQTKESFEQEMKGRAQEKQAAQKPGYGRNAIGPARPAPGFDGPKL